MSDIARTADDALVAISDRSAKVGRILFAVSRLFFAWSIREVVTGWQGRVRWPN